MDSVPDAAEVTIECLPDSTLPNDLRTLGYDVSRRARASASTGRDRRAIHDDVIRCVRTCDRKLDKADRVDPKRTSSQ